MSGKFTRISIRAHNWIEDSTSRAKKLLPQRHHVEGSWAARILGATLLQKRFWSFKGEDLARGLALGMFIAFTPTIGIQMTLVCLTIVFYPGNLPIALAACWLTNPLTAVPVYGTEWYIGKLILELFGFDAGLPPSFFEYKSVGDIIQNIAMQGGTLWFGSIISSAFLAVVSYWGVMWFTYFERWLRRIKLDHNRKVRREERNKIKNMALSELSAPEVVQEDTALAIPPDPAMAPAANGESVDS